MNWIRIEGQQPMDGEEVIINIDGHFYLAVYSARDNSFRFRSGGGRAAKNLHWARLEKPHDEK